MGFYGIFYLLLKVNNGLYVVHICTLYMDIRHQIVYLFTSSIFINIYI